ncbi:hypothetical protein [Bosea sp. (in: a-proteobacteria)]|uniref:hypothetical protein n=1 Tax=Bosea sp. (in: a-proteobacteria) TaxID=1871050 RepID=UPI002616909A|nr:hypothetical protein [Bosea sp. (in: a-proteobacteria)]MCO5092849.1 hypothetical protein [Bosea sp. (in: a-proteobacteria)]
MRPDWSEPLLPYCDMRFDFEMKRGLYMLEGQGLYLPGDEWHEIRERDFIWMGGCCRSNSTRPDGDACHKNVNRGFPL